MYVLYGVLKFCFYFYFIFEVIIHSIIYLIVEIDYVLILSFSLFTIVYSLFLTFGHIWAFFIDFLALD